MGCGARTVNPDKVVETSFFSNLYPTSQRNEWRLAVMNGHSRLCKIWHLTGDHVENC